MSRTFAVGDIHGDIDALNKLLRRLPKLKSDDTLLFIGDYIDRGPKSKEVVERIRELPRKTSARVVALRGNHEDAWLRVIDEGWAGFVLPQGNGCAATYNSFRHRAPEAPLDEEAFTAMFTGKFFPPEVIAWFRALPLWYDDEHAIYVHAGLPGDGRGGFLHPRDAPVPTALLWTRTESFFRNYRGKRVVVGHTRTSELPRELSAYTVDDPSDLWAGPCVTAIDTGCGRDGFLTAIEFPSMTVYESR